MSEAQGGNGARILVQHASKWYGNVVAVNDISFDLRAGVTGLLGPNGAGKTTLLRVASRVRDARAGRVTVLGDDHRSLSRQELARRLAVVPQDTPIAFPFRASEVVLTYVDRGLIERTRSFPGGRRLLFAVRHFGEPFRFGLAPEEVARFLRDRGFELLEDIGGEDFSARYFTSLGRTDRATETERVARARIAGA